MEQAQAYIDGQVLIFNKPLEWTSFDLVKKIRNRLFKKYQIRKLKVGHAGTLDPLAEGLMIVCVGKATKKIESFMGMDKEYVAIIEFGKTTPSFDLETEFDGTFPIDHITLALIKSKLGSFMGEQDQTPPVYSAKKIEGKRAYEYAREHKEVKMRKARICIDELEILSYKNNILEIRIVCGKGTYIRSFAYDLGKALESGAYLSGLKRTRIGPYLIKDALNIEGFEED